MNMAKMLRSALPVLISGFVVLAGGGDARAGKEQVLEFKPVGEGVLLAQQIDRRIPGQAPPMGEEEDLRTINPGAVPPPAANLPTQQPVPVSDRWRIVEAIGVNERWWDPYNQNTLKADRPIFEDYFINILLISDTVFEPRAFPVPVGVQTTNNAGSLDTFGDINQYIFNQNIIASFSLIKGDTAFKPPDFELRFTPVINYNYADVEERRLLNIDPDKGTTRADHFFAIQEAFLDLHLQNVSDRYDFDSVRFGIQPFISDFRGFLFLDQQLGMRLFGTRDNNIFQYNLAVIKRVEKDTNSGLNDITQDLRDDYIFLANLYWQDFPSLGFTSQATVVYNRNQEDGEFYYNKNGFLERPASFGDERPRSYDVVYLGLSGDGHFGRLNLTGSFYYAIGRDKHNQFSGKDDADIRAMFLALEPSVDFSWIRLRGSFLYASGDDDAQDNTEGGFDAIFENPQFAGADTSFWIRQAIPLIDGGGVIVSGRNALLPSLRSSKELGQSNFNNPGLWLFGVGADLDITPELRLFGNANYLRFDNTDTLEFLLNQGGIDEEIGLDLSFALQYRPFFTQNIVLRASAAMLFAGEGFKDIYRANNNSDDLFYSVLLNLILTY